MERPQSQVSGASPGRPAVGYARSNDNSGGDRRIRKFYDRNLEGEEESVGDGGSYRSRPRDEEQTCLGDGGVGVAGSGGGGGSSGSDNGDGGGGCDGVSMPRSETVTAKARLERETAVLSVVAAKAGAAAQANTVAASPAAGTHASSEDGREGEGPKSASETVVPSEEGATHGAAQEQRQYDRRQRAGADEGYPMAISSTGMNPSRHTTATVVAAASNTTSDQAAATPAAVLPVDIQQSSPPQTRKGPLLPVGVGDLSLGRRHHRKGGERPHIADPTAVSSVSAGAGAGVGAGVAAAARGEGGGRELLVSEVGAGRQTDVDFGLDIVAGEKIIFFVNHV